MVIPMFREEYENKSLKELIEIRRELLKSINWYEENHIIKEHTEKPEIIVCPSPEVVYSVENDDLIMLTMLIKEKLKEKSKS